MDGEGGIPYRIFALYSNLISPRYQRVIIFIEQRDAAFIREEESLPFLVELDSAIRDGLQPVHIKSDVLVGRREIDSDLQIFD
ncbi:hypothetical protein D9M71_822850 [compost metagenome]